MLRTHGKTWVKSPERFTKEQTQLCGVAGPGHQAPGDDAPGLPHALRAQALLGALRAGRPTDPAEGNHRRGDDAASRRLR